MGELGEIARYKLTGDDIANELGELLVFNDTRVLGTIVGIGSQSSALLIGSMQHQNSIRFMTFPRFDLPDLYELRATAKDYYSGDVFVLKPKRPLFNPYEALGGIDPQLKSLELSQAYAVLNAVTPQLISKTLESMKAMPRLSEHGFRLRVLPYN
jgi:hypothetical protein